MRSNWEIAASVTAAMLLSGGCGVANTARQQPVLGQPSAPVAILVYEDFQCADCARLNDLLKRFRERYPEEVQIVFKHSPPADNADAALAHEAAVEAEEQGKFFEMHDLLFANQGQLKEADLLRVATQAKLDTRRLQNALRTRVHRAAVERDKAEGRAVGVSRLPAMFVNGRRLAGLPTDEQFANLVHKVAGRSIIPVVDSSSPRPGDLDLTGSPSRGASDAKITVVEFSDFRCGYCARVRSTVAQIVSRYDGKVRWVFKNFPSPSNDSSMLAHKAAMAASAQNRFWEMHDALFSHPGNLTERDVVAMAASLQLDTKRFTVDLRNESFEQLLQRDKREGQKYEVKGTPTFFINGERVLGAAPEEVFVKAIEHAMLE